MTATTPSAGSSRRTHRTRARRAGAALLELAVTLLVLLTLTFGTIEFGYFFFLKNTVQGAAREGARTGIVPGSSNTDINGAVNRVLTAAGLSTGSFSITVKVNGSVANASTAAAGQNVEVTVTAPYGTVGMRPLGVIAANKNVLGVASMRREGQ